ncbi:AraC family transcriptional regulator [Paenibacillus sp. S150]|uniref:AraC family transcriptional regulator n=1 Tax=Paenibacillus sp. S150 TaxID=2749826 RepID=UPI001C5988BB|nr:AraC family transcriptional regulator [Paenibacillus sp. S150]MBW4080657.1 AraC family transcriptional regulator [Paenibacillus sp. S150]
MIVENQLLLWNQAVLKIMDVRRLELAPGGQPHLIRLPENTLLYTIQGRARLLRAGEEHILEQGYAYHAGKGAVLTFTDISASLSCYGIQYRAALPLPCSRELLDLLELERPFERQYGFAAIHAAPLSAALSRMEQEWRRPGALAKLQVKSLFYQFMCELMGQLQRRRLEPASPDMAVQAARYIAENYTEPITADTIAALFKCSPRTLQRLFKKRLGLGPIDYLQQVRMDKAKALLSRTDAGLKEISEAAGYADSYYFSRLFKRCTGVSPSTYREWIRQFGDSESERASVPALSPAAGGIGSSGKTLMELPDTASRRSLRTAVHLKGELPLTRLPGKIAVLDPQFTDHMLALGEQPAGSVTVNGDPNGFPEYLIGSLRTVRTLGTKNEPDLEALRALAPDLILCTEFQKSIYDRLAQIAPTIMLKRNHDWKETLRIIGRIVGKEREAEQILQRYKQKIGILKSDLAAKLHGQSVTVIRPRDNSIRLHTSAHRTAAILYGDLGLCPPKQAVHRQRTSSMISLESLSELDADHYFVLTGGHLDTWPDEVQNTATWKNLRAVRQDHVYPAKMSMWIAYYGPIAMNRVVDQVAEVFLNAK